ncbi:MAG: hypothetical protein ACRDV0_02515 [Acidimicrobiales bacterium]
MPRPRVLATLEGYAVEGGFDQQWCPATCFAPTVALGRHAGPGDADGLWVDYESVLDAAADANVAGVRLTIEWARVEPARGRVDEAALVRYRDAVAHAEGRGLSVTVALVDAAWPGWLGQEAWLLPWVVPHVIGHARRVAESLSGLNSRVVVFADAGRIISRGFVDGVAPPWRRGARDDARRAAAQVAEIDAALSRDPVVAPLLVGRWRTVNLDNLGEGSDHSDVDELYVRALVAGAGPTKSSRGLLERAGDSWVVADARGLARVRA